MEEGLLGLNTDHLNKYILGEQEIFALLKKEVKNYNLSYVRDYGYRVFFKDGYSWGICSNNFLNDASIFNKISYSNQGFIDEKSLRYSMGDLKEKILPNHSLEELFSCKRKNKKIIDTSHEAIFTKTQSELLSLMAKGYVKTKAIAKIMGIHVRTVEWHIRLLKEKTKTRNKADLVDLARLC